jgi:hypothetical protein
MIVKAYQTLEDKDNFDHIESIGFILDNNKKI